MIQAEVLHRLPGRLRVRADGLCGQAILLHRVEQDLSTLPGVKNVVGNSTTGSVLVEYDVALQSESQLLDCLLNRHDIAVEGSGDVHANPGARYLEGNPPRLARAIQSPFYRADRILFDLTDGYLDLRYSVPVAFVLIGTWKVLRTSAQPSIPWYMYYWMALNLFSMFRVIEDKNNQPKTSTAEEAVLKTNTSA